ncbi:ABC transporter permease [Selenomonas sputigena]|uniref:Putative hemin transport system permease protein HrtB n=1 Tax=Selenomonas sputigena TaxID=69823 RepID=A0ABV3X756_9FIRM
MRFPRFLAVRNCRKRSSRSFALGLVAGVLSLVLFGGSLMIISLQNGLAQFKERLGADVIVLPREAQQQGRLEGVLVQGIPANFYMEDSCLAVLRRMPGVERATPQFFLASANSECCSVPVQIIGFDPATDFTIQPWIHESFSGSVGQGDILVGSGISVHHDRMIKFYNIPCRVVGRLNPTGTGMDTAVYTDMDTIRTMMKNATDLNFDYFKDVPAERAISAVLLKTAEGFSPEAMAEAINQEYPQLTAKPAHGMISSVGQGLGAITGTIGVLLFMVWLLSAIILVVAFRMVVNERRREFAILLVAGATRGMLVRIVLLESLLVCAIGAAIGIFAGSAVILPFAGMIKTSLARPYLLPDAVSILLLAAGAFFVTVVSGALSAAWTVRLVADSDVGMILREDG